jgi:hypothetical protein
MTTQRLILIGASCVYAGLLVATAYFTRATVRRVAGALSGGVAVGVVGVGIEILAHTLGWWRYPSVQTSYGPPLLYPAVVLLFAALALIGWRVTRRFGWARAGRVPRCLGRFGCSAGLPMGRTSPGVDCFRAGRRHPFRGRGLLGRLDRSGASRHAVGGWPCQGRPISSAMPVILRESLRVSAEGFGC